LCRGFESLLRYHNRINILDEESRLFWRLFMLRMLQGITIDSKVVSKSVGSSMQHEMQHEMAPAANGLDENGGGEWF
jgi:hypothetical protein